LSLAKRDKSYVAVSNLLSFAQPSEDSELAPQMFTKIAQDVSKGNLCVPTI